MANATDFMENAIINHFLRPDGYTYAQPYVGILINVSGDPGLFDEVTGGSYARVLVDFFPPNPSGQTWNSNAVTFPTAQAAWGSASGIGIFNNPSAGNMLIWNHLTAITPIASGQTISFPISGIAITVL
jgi:hypothetical protein